MIELETVADEVFGFHCQQAAEKMIKALLAERGVSFSKTHNIAALIDTAALAGVPLPEAFEDLAALTPFGALCRYEGLETAFHLDRHHARATLRELRKWIETRIEPA